MTRTPWGDSQELRGRRLRPGYRLPRATVERNQRARLLGAMVAVVAERGYDATNVSHVVELSGVSRTAFYRQFSNKEECFLAVVDEVLEFTGAAVAKAWNEPGSWEERLRAAFDAFVRQVVEQPAAAQMCMIDTYAAGPAGVARANTGAALFERMIGQSLEQSPERAGMPAPVVRAVVGGIQKVMTTRLRRGEAAELPALVPKLWEWAITYETPSTPLAKPRVRRSAAAESSFAPRNQRERICAAVAAMAAENGYAALRIEEVVARAGMSLSSFYNHFATREEAFEAAYEVGLRQAFAAVLPAYEQQEDWRHGVNALNAAILDHLTAEEAWARLGIVESLAAGPGALERRDDALATFAALLQPGLETQPGLSPVAAEAIAGGVYALIYDHISAHGVARLAELRPAATFVALAPFVGADEAVAIANERPRHVRPT